MEIIKKEDVMSLLCKACPSFIPILTEVREFNEEQLLYIELGEFSRHLIDLMEKGLTGEFEEIFKVVERLHLEGDEYVKEAVTIGLLEGIQCVAGNNGIEPDKFVPYFMPETLFWWERLNDFFSGKEKLVYDNRKEN